MPDRERGWQHVQALWPDIKRHGWRVDVAGEHDEQPADPNPRRPALTRDEIAEMVATSEWLKMLGDDERRIVALGVASLAAGRKRVPWSRLLRPLGLKSGAGAVGERYRRAVSYLAFRLNGRDEAAARRLAQRRDDGWRDVFGAESPRVR